MRQWVPALAAGRVEVRGEGFHHLARVLRVRPGDAVVLFDGAGIEADAVVVAIDEDRVALEAAVPRAVAPPALSITLLMALIKGEKMDWVVQKATELGVARVVPLEAARSVVRLDEDRAGGRRDRWGRIAREAARQCGRADVPEIDAPIGVAAAVAAASGIRLILHESARETLGHVLAGGIAGPVTVAVGPEGGFTAEEIGAALEAGFAVAGLGSRILRAETAALAVLAILGFAGGDLGR